jgi:predicted O-methyltransferase YrrM
MRSLGPALDPELRDAARRAAGFMPEADGLQLYAAGLRAGGVGPLLEIGSYCGRSSIYLGAAARAIGTVLFSVDHHRGSEEHQPGGPYQDDLVMDTLPKFRETVRAAGLEEVVIAIVGRSETVASHWSTPLGLVFIDGGHSEEAAQGDYEGWARHVLPGGLLLIHDVFPDPAEGGRAPFHVYRRALDSGPFVELRAVDSLRILQRVGAGR